MVDAESAYYSAMEAINVARNVESRVDMLDAITAEQTTRLDDIQYGYATIAPVDGLRVELSTELRNIVEAFADLSDKFQNVIRTVRNCVRDAELKCEDGTSLDEFLAQFQIN